MRVQERNGAGTCSAIAAIAEQGLRAFADSLLPVAPPQHHAPSRLE
jgi:hypothetical protein